jgi:GTP:adenosylcobinamide-phosphate guanylyltransferase
VHGIDAVPCGINIINGAKNGEEQVEMALLIASRRIAVNVNTPDDIAAAELVLCTHTS